MYYFFIILLFLTNIADSSARNTSDSTFIFGNSLSNISFTKAKHPDIQDLDSESPTKMQKKEEPELPAKQKKDSSCDRCILSHKKKKIPKSNIRKNLSSEYDDEKLCNFCEGDHQFFDLERDVETITCQFCNCQQNYYEKDNDNESVDDDIDDEIPSLDEDSTSDDEDDDNLNEYTENQDEDDLEIDNEDGVGDSIDYGDDDGSMGYGNDDGSMGYGNDDGSMGYGDDDGSMGYGNDDGTMDPNYDSSSMINNNDIGMNNDISNNMPLGADQNTGMPVAMTQNNNSGILQSNDASISTTNQPTSKDKTPLNDTAQNNIENSRNYTPHEEPFEQTEPENPEHEKISDTIERISYNTTITPEENDHNIAGIESPQEKLESSMTAKTMEEESIEQETIIPRNTVSNIDKKNPVAAEIPKSQLKQPIQIETVNVNNQIATINQASDSLRNSALISSDTTLETDIASDNISFDEFSQTSLVEQHEYDGILTSEDF